MTSRSWCYGLLGVLLALAAAVPAGAQPAPGQVEGVVVDPFGDPLPGVNVVLQGTLRGAATDAEGRFTIPRVPPGTYTLVVSALGYDRVEATITVAASETVTRRFQLGEAPIEGEEVVVTASRRAEQALEAPLSVDIVRPEALAARNLTGLDQALRYVPGVQISDNQVSIRGSSGFAYNVGSRVLLLVDGMPLLGPDTEGIPFDALPLSEVARIEVVKGPGSALYGGGALGGVINLITRDAPETPETTAALYGGVYAPTRFAAWRAGWAGGDAYRPYGGLDLSHARRLSARVGGWVSLALQSDAGYLDASQSTWGRGAAKVSWRRRPTQRLDVLTSVLVRRRDNFLYWNGLDDPLSPGVLPVGAGVRGTNDVQTTQLSLLPGWSQTVSATLTYHVRLRLFAALIQPLDDDGTPRPVSAGTAGARYGGETQWTWQAGPDRFLTAGASADALLTASSFFQPEGAPRETYRQPEAAAFAQWEQPLGPLRATAGLRYDAYWLATDHVEGRWSPKLNLAWRVRPRTSLRASAGRGFRVPSIAERFTSNQSFLPIIANLDLRPELSTGVEAGVRHAGTLGPFGTFRLDAALFWTTYDRLVEAEFIASESAFQFVNLTDARTRGAEIQLDVDLPLGVEGHAAYTFVDADDLTAGEPLAFRAQHLVHLSSTLPLPRRLTAAIDYRYASRPERVQTDFARLVEDAETMVDTHVLDLRLMARRGPLRAILLLRNALNYHYVERPAILAPPRELVLRLEARF